MLEIKNIAIVGAGAVGTFYGAKLKQAGYSVQFYSSHAAEINAGPVEIESLWGDFSVDVPAFTDTRKMERSELIFISSKAYDTIDYKGILQPLVYEKSILVLLQNGINQEDKLAYFFPDNVILGALAFTCINRINPRLIRHIDYGNLKLGPREIEHGLWARFVTDILNKAGIETSYDIQLRQLRWEKLLWNVPFNSLSVLGLKASTEQIVNSPLEDLASRLMWEIWNIAQTEGVVLDKKLIKIMMERTRNMKSYKTSMLLDFEAGRKMEVEAILGEPLRIAEKYGLQTPTLYTVYRLLSFYNEQLK